MLIDYGTTQVGYFPPRPERFTLDDDDRHFLSCLGFEGWNVIFTDRGQAAQAFVKLGPYTRKSDAAESAGPARRRVAVPAAGPIGFAA